MCNQQFYKISSKYVHFWLCNGPKPDKGDDVTFLIAFLAFFNCLTSKQMTFLEF